MDEETSSESALHSSTFESEEGNQSASSSSVGEECASGENQRRKRSRKTFLEGKARMPYRLRKRLRTSLDANDTEVDENYTAMVDVCKQCSPALSKIREGFVKHKRQGS